MSLCYYEQDLRTVSVEGLQHRASAQTTLNLMFEMLSMVGCHPTVLLVSVMRRQSSVNLRGEIIEDTSIIV